MYQYWASIYYIQACRNSEPHLRGNVYVQFKTGEMAVRALELFNARWYAGYQLSAELCPVKKWRVAICHDRDCPKGRQAGIVLIYTHTYKQSYTMQVLVVIFYTSSRIHLTSFMRPIAILSSRRLKNTHPLTNIIDSIIKDATVTMMMTMIIEKRNVTVATSMIIIVAATVMTVDVIGGRVMMIIMMITRGKRFKLICLN